MKKKMLEKENKKEKREREREKGETVQTRLKDTKKV